MSLSASRDGICSESSMAALQLRSSSFTLPEHSPESARGIKTEQYRSMFAKQTDFYGELLNDHNLLKHLIMSALLNIQRTSILIYLMA
jgi:hypothetical protein